MLQRAFDLYAESYDRSFTDTKVGRMQRASVRRALLPVLRPGSDIFEINAGTGADAIWLAGMGHRVVATDLSEGMVNLIRRNAGQAGVSLMVKQRDVRDLGQEAPASADIIFSNFGGLNCIGPDEWNSVATGAFRVLRTNGRMVLVVMGRKCIWERLYFTFKPSRGDKRRRSLKGGVQTIINSEQFNTWYYSPEEVAGLLSGYFRVEFVRPVGLMVPPSYLDPLISRIPGLPWMLGTMDKFLAGWSSAADHADHFLICLRKEKAR